MWGTHQGTLNYQREGVRYIAAKKVQEMLFLLKKDKMIQGKINGLVAMEMNIWLNLDYRRKGLILFDVSQITFDHPSIN